jgi:hypothetical protein
MEQQRSACDVAVAPARISGRVADIWRASDWPWVLPTGVEDERDELD